mmetsp:Transcript_39130/g.75916  ORF Transcript_39130/g.75916 Transcript_39130/m.75916 type:complete len:176 (+) Transcript_39130:1-528(+)
MGYRVVAAAVAVLAACVLVSTLSFRTSEYDVSYGISASRSMVPQRTMMMRPAYMNREVACNAAGKGKTYNTQIVVGNDPEQVAIKKFTRSVQSGGFIQEAKRRRFFEPKVERMKRKVREEHARRKLIRKFTQQESRALSRGAKPPKRAQSYNDIYGVENDPFSDLFDNEGEVELH